MHNRLAVTYDITSYSEMITEILCPDVLKAVQYCKQISGTAQKGQSVGSVVNARFAIRSILKLIAIQLAIVSSNDRF